MDSLKLLSLALSFIITFSVFFEVVFSFKMSANLNLLVIVSTIFSSCFCFLQFMQHSTKNRKLLTFLLLLLNVTCHCMSVLCPSLSYSNWPKFPKGSKVDYVRFLPGFFILSQMDSYASITLAIGKT